MATWLFLSGHYSFLLITVGLLASLFVVFLVSRMRLLNSKNVSFKPILGFLRYVPWLIGAIVRSNIDVAGRVLNPRLPINPIVARVPAEQKTDIGRVAYANSITLTPGTVSLDLTGDEIEVHVLSEKSLDELKNGSMARRILEMEKT
ncbi:MAG: cation transporter [Gammaproteobacteria bacterium]|nr:cation transporter [Gammaproteobacteria bacterium]|tara:strand:- start:1780 stop:2220 length:441 start_codon:yes stop_codon:yes gene_type:complete